MVVELAKDLQIASAWLTYVAGLSDKLENEELVTHSSI